MPVNYNVQAQVVDIRADSPRSTDSFLVDTNVWFWITYPKAGGYTPARMGVYPSYLSKSLRSGASRHYCGLSLAELAHLIEKTERESYNAANGMTISAKEYRHNYAAERTKVATEVERTWRQVTSLASALPCTVDATTAANALSSFKSQALDGYDLFILQAAAAGGIVQILTDDGDYCTVPGIQMFTANANAIQAAKTQGRLLVR